VKGRKDMTAARFVGTETGGDCEGETSRRKEGRSEESRREEGIRQESGGEEDGEGSRT
jgi:hypothetical protein